MTMGPYCLQYRLRVYLKIISSQEEQAPDFVTGRHRTAFSTASHLRSVLKQLMRIFVYSADSIILSKWGHTFWIQIRADVLSVLIWIQNVCHSAGIPERVFKKCF